ncbi:MAG: UvrD-helicase domain-containing protein [Elusimicrobiota bacterium]
MHREYRKKQREKLNKPQKEAVEATEGPLLVFAGAGSGKTMVITHRISMLIEKGVSPFNILAVTFTNKAAEEMKNRVRKLAGSEGMSVWISTFHSLGLRILRDDGGKDFTVYDEHDQTVVIKEAMEKLDIDPKKYPPPHIKEIISNAKNNLIDTESYAINAAAYSDNRKHTISRIYGMYQKILDFNSGYDFADLLVEPIRLFKRKPEILEKYRQRFRYILVDEYQDTNYAQYTLLKLLAPPHNNICVVGDDDQCLAEGTNIGSPTGHVPVEKLKKGDTIAGASGWGKLYVSRCDRISRRKYSGKIIGITTRKGNKLNVTPNHMLFARLKPRSGVYYVYLMYKKDLGFRIGITQGVRSKRASNNVVLGLMVRLNQENADKLWIIKTCDTHKKALYYEQYYSVKYGIPTYVFHSKGRNMALDHEDIKSLFDSIDTYRRAAELMCDEMIDPLYPHLCSAGYINRHIDRKIINFTMFGEDRCTVARPWHAHRIQLNTSNIKLRREVERMGFNTRSGQKGTWRVETSRKNYNNAIEFMKELAEAGDVDLVKKARLTAGKPFLYMPASHLHEGMMVPVIDNGRVTEDTVTRIEVKDYDGYVYDISVPDLRNYVAEGLLVHNSIYSWRGADIRNILEFEKNFKSAKTVKLEENYRSTQNILDAAHSVIKNNTSRKQKKLWTRREKGEAVKWQEFLTNREEALGVVAEIKRLIECESFNASDAAVFYRVNAQSRSFEDVLRASGLNYRIIGGVKFYERKEIKDIIAYMKVLVNPYDDVSMLRIINRPVRGIGKETLNELKRLAALERRPLYRLVTEGSENIPENLRKKLKPLKMLFNRLEETFELNDAALLAKEIIELSGYHRVLKEDDDIQARSRLENIEELVSAFAEDENSEKSVSEILNEISLLTDTETWSEDEDYVTLMTIHLAKGLEFPVVFLTGLEEELFPHYDALKDPAQMEEERRLCYVGMTRAQEYLYLTSASQRMLYGQSRWHIPSRFIKESTCDTAGGEKEYYYD